MVDLEKLQQACELGATHYCYESHEFLKQFGGTWFWNGGVLWLEVLEQNQELYGALAKKIDYSSLNGD